MSDTPNTYESSGVSIAAQDAAIEMFKNSVSATHGADVLAGIGSFGAAFAPNLTGISEPVLVSSTDGVGTKVRLHARFGTHAWAGRDLVSAVVNDVICCGAAPMFFLDYLACNKVVPETVNAIVGGMAETCGEISCALIGGEIAEMGATYQPGEYDLAGFAVGLADKGRMLGAHLVEDGDVLIGLASTGVHCNGFSLVRSVFEDLPDEKWNAPVVELGLSLRDSLLAPTRCYARALSATAGITGLHSAAHISGGGIEDNLPRAIPRGLAARVDRSLIQTPAVFDIIQRRGSIDPAEMWHVFNMGVGFVLIAAADAADGIIGKCSEAECPAFVMGKVVAAAGDERIIWDS